MCAFQTVKSVDDGTVRHFSQNDLVGTVSDFSLFQSYTNVPPLLKKYKECSCALPTINIPEDIWFELTLKIIKMRKSSGWKIFCQLKLLLKRMELVSCQKKTCAKPCTLE